MRNEAKDAVFYKRVRNWIIGSLVVFGLLVVLFMAIEEAKANLAAEQLNAEAEVARAKGAAKAIEIEGGKLTDEYIKYLWVRQQKPGAGQVIYVPTEAGLPILEAGQR